MPDVMPASFVCVRELCRLGSSIFQHYALNYATNICFTFGVPFNIGFHTRYRVCRLLRGVREEANNLIGD